MSKTIMLRSGASVTFRDPKTLKAKDRRKIYELANDETGIIQNLTMIEGTAAVLIESWTFDLILPSVRFEMFGELSINDYDDIIKSKEVSDAQVILFANYNSDEGDDSPLDKSSDTLPHSLQGNEQTA